MKYTFADYSLDTDLRELRLRGEPVPLQPKPFALLVYLLQNRGRVVPRSELTEHLWPETRVTEDSLTQAISKVREALRDPRGHALDVRTVRGSGVLLGSPKRVASSGAMGPDGTAERVHRLLGAARGGISLFGVHPGSPGADLVAAIENRPAHSDARVIVSESAHGDSCAIAPWSTALRRLAADHGSEELERIAGPEVGYLGEVFPSAMGDIVKTGGAGDEDWQLALDAIVGILVASARRRPLVLVLEGLEAASPPALLLFEMLAPRVAELPLFVFGTFTDLRARLPEAVAAIGEILVRCEAGEVYRATKPARVGAGPSGVQEAVRALSVDARRVLAGATEDGCVLDFDRIALKTGLSRGHVLACAEEALDAGLLRPPSDHEIRFRVVEGAARELREAS